MQAVDGAGVDIAAAVMDRQMGVVGTYSRPQESTPAVGIEAVGAGARAVGDVVYADSPDTGRGGILLGRIVAGAVAGAAVAEIAYCPRVFWTPYRAARLLRTASQRPNEIQL